MSEERVWRKTILHLSPIQLLETYPDIILTLPTMLAEVEEQKKELERKVTRLLERKTLQEIDLWLIAIREGEKIVRLEKRLKLLRYLIALSAPKNNKMLVGLEEMMRVKEIAKQTPIQVLVGVDVKKRGKNSVCCCPLHNDKTPSFTIFPENRWHCFGCNEGGDSISLVMRMRNCTFKEAVLFLTNTSLV